MSAAKTAQSAADAAAAAAEAAKKAGEAAAATAKAEAISEVMAKVNEALNGYATKDDLTEINSKLASINETLASKADKSYVDELKAAQDQMKTQLEALQKYQEFGTQIGLMQADIDAVKADMTKIQTSLANCVTADQMKKAIDEVSNSLAKKNSAVITLLTGQLRSMVFIPEIYINGIESANYDYLKYYPISASKPETWSNSVLTYSSTKILSAPEVFGWDNWSNVLDANKERVVVYDMQPRQLQYDLNPSSAKFSVDQIELASRFVLTRGSVEDIVGEENVPALVVDKNNTVANENGVMSVGYTLNNAQYLSKIANTNTWENGQSGNWAMIVSAKVNPETNDTTGNGTITSDAAQLVAVELVPSRIVTSKTSVNVPQGWRGNTIYGVNNSGNSSQIAANVADNQYYTPIDVQYNRSLDLNTALSTTFTNGFVADYAKMQELGLSFEYTLIDYTHGIYTTSESAYVALDGSVVTPGSVTTDGKYQAKPSKSSIGRQPMVFVKLMHGTDVVKVGYVKLSIVEDLDATPSTADPIAMTNVYFTCEPNPALATWSQISNVVLDFMGETGMDKVTFFRNYGLVGGNYSAKQYAYNEETSAYTELDSEDYRGTVSVVTDYNQPTTTNVLSWSFDVEDAQKVWAANDKHSISTYVAFSKIDGNGAVVENAPRVYVPISTVIVKPEGEMINKSKQGLWMRDNTTLLFATRIPTVSGNNVEDYVSDLDQAWYHQVGNSNIEGPVIGGLDAMFTKSQANGGVLNSNVLMNSFTENATTSNGYKYYFTATNQKVESLPINGADAKSVNIAFQAGPAGWSTFAEGTPANTSDWFNDPTTGYVANFDNALAQALKNSGNGISSVYDNTTLYAANIGSDSKPKSTTVYTAIAQINQSTGEVTYLNNTLSKQILSCYSSLKGSNENRPDAKLSNYIGTVFYGPCGLVIPVKNTEYESVFLRPLNVSAVAGKSIAGEGGSLALKDLFTFVDWNNNAIPGAKDVNASLYAWYKISSINVDLDNMTTDFAGNGFEKMPVVTSWFKLTKTMPVATSTWNDFSSNLGNLQYTAPLDQVTKDYQIKIPATVSYYWGDIHISIVVKINAMK